MGAGGQQPLLSHRRKGWRQHAAPAGTGRSYHGEKPVLSGAPVVCSAKCGSGDREPTTYDECHRGATRSVEARLG
jgi:hypothetical protein